MDHADFVAESELQETRALFRGGEVRDFAFLDERAYPVSLASLRDMPAQTINHIEELAAADQLCLDRLAARRHLVEAADIHLAIMGEGQRARDRGRGHDQEVRRAFGL